MPVKINYLTPKDVSKDLNKRISNFASKNGYKRLPKDKVMVFKKKVQAKDCLNLKSTTINAKANRTIRYYSEINGGYAYITKDGYFFKVYPPTSETCYWKDSKYTDPVHAKTNKKIQQKEEQAAAEAAAESAGSDSGDSSTSNSKAGDLYPENPEKAEEYYNATKDIVRQNLLEAGDYVRIPDKYGREQFLKDKDGNYVLAKPNWEKYKESTNDVRQSKFGGSITKLMKEIDGIHAMPYQFMDSADGRFEDTGIGRVFKKEIMDNVPLLLLTPGIPKFMEDFDDDLKDDVISALSGNKDEAFLNQLTDGGGGMFYTFQYRFDQYYDYVNTMLRAMSNFLGIGDMMYKGQRLDSFSWQTFATKQVKGFTSSRQNVPFYIDAQTQASENISNTTGPCGLANSINSVSTYANELQFLIGGAGGAKFESMISEFADSALKGLTNVLSSFEKILPDQVVHKLIGGLGTLTTGGKIVFPEIWQDSSYTKSQEVSMKFVSPSGDPFSIYINVLVPLIHLICLAAPRQMGKNGYQAPFLVRAWYKGMFSSDMAIIENLSIRRGDKGKWNKDGLPTIVEVEFSIKDLYGSLSITKRDGALNTDLINNSLLLSYMATMCGINSYKPDIMRTYDLYMTAIKNIPRDIVNSIFDKTSNKIANIFANENNNNLLKILTVQGAMSLVNNFRPNSKKKNENGEDVDVINPNLPEGYKGMAYDPEKSIEEQVNTIYGSMMNNMVVNNRKEYYKTVQDRAVRINTKNKTDKLYLPNVKVMNPEEFAKVTSNPSTDAYVKYAEKSFLLYDNIITNYPSKINSLNKINKEANMNLDELKVLPYNKWANKHASGKDDVEGYNNYLKNNINNYETKVNSVLADRNKKAKEEAKKKAEEAKKKADADYAKRKADEAKAEAERLAAIKNAYNDEENKDKNNRR